MSSNIPPKDHSPRRVKGCAEYRLAMELTLLRRRLETEDPDPHEKTAIEQRVREIERALGV